MEMKTIYSTDNRIYKLCKELTVKKYRDRLAKYIIEGENLIEEAVKSGAAMEYIIIREDYEGDALCFADAAEETVYFSRQLFSQIAQTETSQGIMAVVSKSEFAADDFYNTAKGNLLVLDRLQDPGNIGTMLRTAEAAGYGGVVTIKGTGDIYSPKAVRAAAGSVFRMPVLQGEETSTAAGRIKESGRRIAVTTMDGSCAYYDAGLSGGDAALVIGNEGNGVSDEFLALSDIRVNIPMRGYVESLNAAAAAAILMYENMRK